MDFKLVLILTFIIINIQSCLTWKQGISCSYRKNNQFNYECLLKIENLYGFDDIEGISGTHLNGYSDEYVHRIVGWDIDSENFPRIICEKFKNLQNIDFLHGHKYISHRFLKAGLETLKNFQNLSSMAISLNSMDKINNNTFNGFENLKILKLKNKIGWPESLFLTNQNLEVLSLNSNEIFDLSENIFESLEKLQNLSLSHNQILNLRQKWFTNKKSLKNLYINGNKIRELPKDIFASLISLEIIELGENFLKIIYSNSFGTLPKLTTIYLQDNEINAIDEQLIDNTGLEDIKLIGNKCYSSDFFDNSTTRDALFLELHKCITNYEKIQNRKLYRKSNTIENKAHENMLETLQNKVLLQNQEVQQQQKILQLMDVKIDMLIKENEELKNKLNNFSNKIRRLDND
ncbi:hypothetical protein ACKWTF_001496 [Chironomus riparius]